MAKRKIILLLSGEIASGKSNLSSGLSSKYDFQVLKTRDIIKELSSAPENKIEREVYQKSGNKLDIDTDDKWVLSNFQHRFGTTFHDFDFYIVDSVRTFRQIEHFREAYSHSVFHIHLEASGEVLFDRYSKRDEVKALSKIAIRKKYNEAKADLTEISVPNLAIDADLVINTERCSKEDVLIRVASYFRLLAPTYNELVDVLIGGQFGSEGKGQIAAHIAPEYDCLVRVGGPNAGHSVFENPDKHVFHLLPSGTFRNQRAKIILGAGTVIRIETLLDEIRKYINDEESERLFIDKNAIVISDKDIEEEKKLMATIGSTGQGVGYATANNILARLNGERSHKADQFKELKPFIKDTVEELEKMYDANRRILLEGTQGSALSLHHGLYPFVTSRDTNVAGCLSESGISPKRVKKIIMTTRTYPIRVGGTSGDFLSDEIDMKTVAKRSGKNEKELIEKEKTTTTKKNRRIAEFSWALFRKACELNSPTDIALTFADYIQATNETARRYDQLTPDTQQFIEEIERCSGVKVSLIGTGFDYRAIIDRRNWKG